MDYKKFFFVSIGLWLIVVVFAAKMFIFGKTGTTVDGRNAVILNGSERALVLAEMRGLLQSVHGIIKGVNENDRKLVIKSALLAGTAHMADLDPGLMSKLPIKFKKLGVAVHHDFDALGKLAEKASNEEILNDLENKLAKCVACHASYQLKAEEL